MLTRLVVTLASAALLFVAQRVSAQDNCPQPNPWDGNEPADFKHCTDVDATGVCHKGPALVNGAYPNGTYPTCVCPDGTPQVGHGHWEFTHLQTEGGTGESEEKDYLDTQSDDMAGQAFRFASREPERFDHALRPSANPSGRYWQVDEWIGPAAGDGERIPFLTWTERFFECSGIEACATVNGQAANGGYWSTDAQPLYDAFQQPVDCGEPLTAAGPRSECCGMYFTPFP